MMIDAGGKMKDIEQTETTAQILARAAAALRRGDHLVVQALEEYRRVGEILIEAKETCVRRGEWGAALDEAGINHSAASKYIRLAKYWEAIPEDIREGSIEYDGRGSGHRSGFSLALRSVAHLPRVDAGTAVNKKMTDRLVSEAKQMRNAGATVKDTAEALGVSKSVVQRWTNPESMRKHVNRRRRRKSEKEALLREERRKENARLASDAPRELSKTYSDVRRLALSIDKALEVIGGADADALRMSATSLVSIEATIVEVMRSLRKGQAA